MIYRRYNISRNNYIGDYWMELPGRAEQLSGNAAFRYIPILTSVPIYLLIYFFSVTVDDKLWALNAQHQLLQHENYTISGEKKIKDTLDSSSKGKERNSSTNEEDWEMIN